MFYTKRVKLKLWAITDTYVYKKGICVTNIFTHFLSAVYATVFITMLTDFTQNFT